MTTWKIGTVGFGYKQWLGTFYPTKMPATAFLPYFSRYFDSAELDTTFYGTPRTTTVQKWAANSTPDFTFSPKTPRAITHDIPISHAATPMLQFTDSLRQMGPKLGAILIQYPAKVQADQLTALDDLLAQLPTTLRYAIEFRHPSWQTDATTDMLTRHNACYIAADYGQKNEHNMQPFNIRPTTDWLYMRFIGWHGAFNSKNEVKIDQHQRLEKWLNLLQPHLPQYKTIYAYFNNDYSGYSIATANLLKELLGLDYKHPDLPTQPTLF